MAEQPASGGVGKTSIILALISGFQAIILALVGTGQVPFFQAESADEAAEATEEVAAAAPSLAIDAINLKAETRVPVADCLQRSREALEALEFAPLPAGEPGVARMTSGTDGALVWCYEDGGHDVIVFAAAGDEADATLSRAGTAIRAAFGAEIDE